MQDNAFKPAPDGLAQAVSLLLEGASLPVASLPDHLPETGIGETDTLRMLAPNIVGAAAALGEETAFAHMDPPTPWVTWATTLWNAALNQNLLHPATSPAAKDIERRVIDWLKPHFSMDGGHMTPGATIANLTALWAARDVAGARRVMASEHAHVSVKKSAHLLGLRYEGIAVDGRGRLDRHALPSELRDTCLVLTAGTTSTGAIDAVTPGEFRRGGEGLTLEWAFGPTPFGDALLACSPRGIVALRLGDRAQREQRLADLRAEWPGAVFEPMSDGAAAVAAVFEPGQSRVDLLLVGTPFQHKVWQALVALEPGETVSYATLAARIGQPGSARAVGGAVGANSVAILIPCHRVLRADGGLGGYRWGPERKRVVLAWEQCRGLAAAESEVLSSTTP